MSKALVRISTGGAKCCDILGDLRTGRHEMVIYRGDDRVWEGPITRLAYRPGEVEIDARDVMFYPTGLSPGRPTTTRTPTSPPSPSG